MATRSSWPGRRVSRRLIHGLLKIQDAGERDEAGRAVAAVCARIADDARQADPVLDAYHKATPAEQLVLLPVLGRIGGTKALVLIREAVAGPDPKRRDSGRQALFNWPDSTVADDLASLAETASDRDLKNRAIHAWPGSSSCRAIAPTTPGSPSLPGP